MARVDVTEWIEIDWIDDGVLKIEKCVCGARPEYFVIDTDPSADGNECPECGRKFQFVQTVAVYEVTP